MTTTVYCPACGCGPLSLPETAPKGVTERAGLTPGAASLPRPNCSPPPAPAEGPALPSYDKWSALRGLPNPDMCVETAPPPSGHGYGYECNVTPFAYCKLSKGHPGEHVASVLWPPPSGDPSCEACAQEKREGLDYAAFMHATTCAVRDQRPTEGDPEATMVAEEARVAARSRAGYEEHQETVELSILNAPASAGDKSVGAASAPEAYDSCDLGTNPLNDGAKTPLAAGPGTGAEMGTGAAPSEPEPGAWLETTLETMKGNFDCRHCGAPPAFHHVDTLQCPARWLPRAAVPEEPRRPVSYSEISAIQKTARDAQAARAAAPKVEDPGAPTHRCRVCGALWWFGYVSPVGMRWSLRSPSCGRCCDNVEMGRQIESIGVYPERFAALEAVREAASALIGRTRMTASDPHGHKTLPAAEEALARALVVAARLKDTT